MDGRHGFSGDLVQLILNPQAAISRVEYGARSMFPSD
uniref:Uncharacterized protein n=1 Tax=Candidatus Kentrum sp. DK TaxID=2126562 RepID=A0A450T1J5_9GAMM|nr:MAG: hypothetical protein BECKDK2373B_GA0170837_10552 [Candidatus Kentron sp. DK]VFJ60145.1 MAG: hypothetical protein BECKDK2373C_GA0170839_107817 [Candidatus Kentron sp. DK]